MKDEGAVILRLVEDQLGMTGIGERDHLFRDLGIESVDLLNIASAMEERFGIEIEESRLAEVRVVRDLFPLVGAEIDPASG